MESHVKAVAILHIVLGGLGALAAVIILTIFGGIAGIVGATAPRGDAVAAVPILGVIGGALSILVLLLSLPAVIAGFGLLSFQPWARILTIVLSALNLLNVPIGTALGAYSLWVMLNTATEALFRPGARV